MKKEADTGTELTGTPEQLGKRIYRLLCGKKEEKGK